MMVIVVSVMMDLCCRVGVASNAVLVAFLITPQSPVFQLVHQGILKTFQISNVSKLSIKITISSVRS